MAKIFITGGTGLIGASIAKELISQNDEVLLFDSYLNFIDPTISNYEPLLKLRLEGLIGKAKIVRGDIRHKGTLMQIMQQFSPTIVIHLAALPIAKESNMYPEDASGINLLGTINVLECVRNLPSVKRFVYASSSMVYGNFQRIPADEDHPLNPIEVYGATKLAGEILTKAYGTRFGVEWTIIRPSAVYGPTDANRRVTQIFVENALMGKTLKLEGGGETRLDFTYIKDITQGFILAMKSEKAKNEIFNITNGEGRSLKELSDILKELIPSVRIEVSPIDMKRPERGTLDISKARKLLGYNPEYTLEKGMKEYVDFVKKSGVLRV